MPRILASNNKGSRLSTNNNKDIQKMAAKKFLSYYGKTKVPNVSASFVLGLLMIDIRNCKSKRITRNKDIPLTIMSAATKK